MKKIFSIITVFLSVCLQGFAQQFINLYQDNVVIKQYSTEEIDSMSVSETEPRIVSFWRDGDVFQTYNAADIDSIKVSNRGGAPLSYIGIVGFNSQLQTKDIGILSPSTASQYMSFVSNLPKRDGSILYYAVDNALDMLEDAHIESPLKSVNVITFTDGLDQGSLMMTDKYSSSAAYLDALDERIAQAKDSELSTNFYALGLRGSDVSDMSQFRQNLQRLASSADNVFEVSSISDLRAKFQDIANQIISVSTRQSMSVRVIGVETGTRMRFVFDGNSAATSELYIEGTFNLQDLSLHNVTYHGIKATSGKTVQGTQDGIFVTYTFTGMRLEAGTSLIPTSSVKHYYMYPSSTSWQANSEFTPTGDTQRNVSHSGTLIFLVLDCSSSLSSDFSRMQQYANEFIDLIASNAEPYEFLAPTNVKAVIDENDLVVNVSWDAVKYAQSYNVYRSSSSSGTYSLVAEGVTSTIWTDDSPLKGYNYYKVCAKNWNEASSQSSYASVTVNLAAPTNVKAELEFKDEKFVVNVSWNAVKYAQSYDVYRSNSSDGTYELVAENIPSTTWTDLTPVYGNSYYYKVYAKNRNVVSTQSPYASVTVNLSTPTNVKAVIDENDLVVNVSWDAVKYAESYNVFRSSSSGGTYSWVAKGVTSTTWKDESPQKGYNYYEVRAVGYGTTSSQSSYSYVNVSLAAPTNVEAEIDENDLVVNVSWDAVKYAQSYKVYRSSSSNGTYELVAEGVTSTTWKDSSPLSGSNYYKVCAVNRKITSAQSSYSYVNVSLAAPTNVKAELEVKDEKFVVNVSWDAVKYAQSYKVYRSSSSGGTYSLVDEGVTSTTWKDSSPLSGSNYYKVCAVNRKITSAQSSHASVEVRLAYPTNVKAVIDENDLVVNVSWDAVKHAQSYDVYRSSSSSGTYSLVAEGVTSTTWKDESPQEGYNYYKVCAVGYGITSSQSSYTSVTVSLSAPTNVKAVIDENNLVVNVSWDAVKYAQSYKVYRSSSSGGTYSLVDEGVTSTTWKDSSPLSGSNYYKVCAVNRKITSAQSSYTSVNVSLSTPTNIKAEVDVKDDNFVVNVSWDAVKYAQSYDVYRSSSYDGTDELVAENIPSTTWTDLTPVYGNSYYYKVYAKNRNVVSNQSEYASVTVNPAAPTNVKAVIDENDLVVNVSWDAVKYAESYNVYRCSSPSGTYSLIAGRVTSTSWTDNNPLNGNNYYKVNTLYKDKISALSNAVRALDPTKGSIITVNGVAFNMVKVSGGTFQMGATSEQGSDVQSNEKPVHQVTLSDYYIGETEVTQELWKAVMGSNPSYFTGSGLLPVEEVSWNDCQTFITKLNVLTGMQFRLPTEAEWEFAARGGNSSQGYKYSGSNNLDDVAWYGYTNNSNSWTHEVGTKAPNELGLYDMSGNVGEWCQDWYGSYSSSAQTNPTGPTSGSKRVIRGGDYYNSGAWGCRVSHRHGYTPDNWHSSIGLRLAL